MNRLKLATAIFLCLAAQGLVYGVDIVIRHGFDPAWPAHARYHVALSGIHIVTLALITAVAALGGLTKARRSAWIMLAIASTVGWSAWPLGRFVAGEPPPPLTIALTTGSLAAGLLALALSYGPCFREADAVE